MINKIFHPYLIKFFYKNFGIVAAFIFVCKIIIYLILDCIYYLWNKYDTKQYNSYLEYQNKVKYSNCQLFIKHYEHDK